MTSPIQPGKLNLGYQQPKPGMDADIEKAARPYVDAVSGVQENGPQFAREARWRDMRAAQLERLEIERPEMEAETRVTERYGSPVGEHINKKIAQYKDKYLRASQRQEDEARAKDDELVKLAEQIPYYISAKDK